MALKWIQYSNKDEIGIQKLLTLRRELYYDKDKDRLIELLSNIMQMTVKQINLLYKMQWQIKTLFKQLKQNFPLKNFPGDNENFFKSKSQIKLLVQP